MKSFYFFILFVVSLGSCQKQNQASNALTNLSYTDAIKFRDQQKADSAFLYFNKAKEIFSQQNDSLGVAKCLVNMAIISTNLGDYFGGQELSLAATVYLKTQNKTHYTYIKSNYNNLGIAEGNLKSFQKAITFYKQSLKFATDTADALVIKNNIAHAYQQNKEYSSAIKYYREILKKETDDKNYARALSNLAFTKWLQNSNFNPISDLQKALAVRNADNDLWGQNASFGYMADYYLNKQTDTALYYATKMLYTSKVLNTPDEQIAALSKLIKLSPYNKVKTYFNQYQSLNDSLQKVRNAAKNQFALIRFETEQYKAASLKLQKENTDRNVFIYVMLLSMAASSIVAVLWYQKRKERLAFETQNSIKENQLKMSKKVHDIVANGLYRLMSELENQNKKNREQVLDEMEILYEKSRDISYEDDETLNNSVLDFDQTLKKLFTDFASNQVKVVIIGNETAFWNKITVQVRTELYQVLLELMVNMRKHSKASYVAIRFEQQIEHKAIYYTDNGIGISELKKFNNGLQNTGNRIKSINGSITFDKCAEGGLKILILFPAT